MDNDISRKKLEFKMFCSKHPNNELTFSLDSRLRASSAHVVNAEILIHPCSQCRMETARLKDAAKLLMSAANEEQ